MRKNIFIFTSVLFIAGLSYAWYSYNKEQDSKFCRKTFKHQFIIEQAHSLFEFDLVDPQQAPPEIRESVMRGYQLMLNTSYYVPDFSQNHLSCTNCHFCGGDTLGGKNGGISLVGVTTLYPQFSKRDNKTIDLKQRIKNCFERSMNGVAPDPNSKIMLDILAYLDWISKEVDHIDDIPWLGLPAIKSTHTPDPVKGRQLYTENCAACHHEDGQGGGVLGEVEGKTIPPLWGPYSFNDGAGMSTLKMMAPFIYLNMPYQQANLSEEDALDIAEYVRKQPRPKFKPSTK